MAQWEGVLTEMGVPCTVADIQAASREVYRLGRELDYRQGFTHDDATLPDRFFEQIPGQGTPQLMTREFFEELKPRVYAGLSI